MDVPGYPQQHVTAGNYATVLLERVQMQFAKSKLGVNGSDFTY